MKGFYKILLTGLSMLFLTALSVGLPGCASKTSNQATSSSSMLNELMIAELALKRKQYEQAYDAYNRLINEPLANTDFVAILASLKASQHKTFRQNVISQWYKQYPDNLDAITAYMRIQVCQDPAEALPQLELLADKLANSLRLDTIMDCLTPATKSGLLASLAEQTQHPDIKVLYCRSLAEQEQFTEVIYCIEQLEEISRTVDVLGILAQAQMALGQLLQAEKTYLSILDMSPGDNDSRYELAALYYQKDQYLQAIEQLQKLLETEPNNRNIHYLLASSYFSLADYENSKVWFEELLKVIRYRNSALYYLGMIAIDNGDTDQAMSYLDSVTDSEFYLPAQLNLWRLISETDTDLAIEGLYQLIEALPSDRMTIKLAQIDILERAGEDQRATQEVVSLADDYPLNLRLQILRLQWLIDRNYLDKVNANLSASLESLQEVTAKQQLVENTVFYLIDQQLGPTAISVLESQNVLPRENEQFKYLYALSEILSENYKPGLAMLEQLTQNRPESLEYKNALAYSMTLAGTKLDFAEQLLASILEQEPDNAAYLDSLGWLYFVRGNYEKAQYYLEKANNILSSASIKAHLIELYLKQDRINEARELALQATSLFPRHRVVSKLVAKPELQPLNQ
jgi:tetratricopeptide (TPR) repeat protein